jgi:hypothetical protein
MPTVHTASGTSYTADAREASRQIDREAARQRSERESRDRERSDPMSWRRDWRDGKISFEQAVADAQREGMSNAAARITVSQIRQPGGGGGSPPVGGNNQQGDPLTAAQILAAVKGGAITREEAIDSLVKLGGFWNTTTAGNTVDATLGGQGFEGQVPEAPLGPTIPTSEPFKIGQLQDVGDIARQFVTGQGIAPGFRDFATQGIMNRGLPFMIQAATGNMPGVTPEDIQAPNIGQTFRQFLQGGGQSQLPTLSGGLRTAANFLRSPSGIGGEFNDIQQALFDRLTDEKALGTSSFFNPIVSALGSSRNFGRNAFGFNFGGALQKSLQNQLAQDPTRFEGPSSFIDWLSQQGIV